MATISNFVDVAISSASARIRQAGFGIPMIASYHTNWVDRTRTYEDPADMLTDGFEDDEGAYLAAVKLCQQDPRPEEFVVGRLDTAPAYRWAITPVVGNVVKYSMYIDGLLVEFTSDGSGTATEIIAGLTAAAATAGVTGITFSDQTTYLRALATTAGEYHTIKSNDISKLTVAQDNAAPANLSAELDAILLDNATWFAFHVTGSARATVLAIAAWAETNKKAYFVQLQDSSVATEDYDNTGASDTASALKLAGYEWTSWWYHADGASFLDCAVMGAVLPLAPGSETWAFKQLAGVDALTLRSSWRSNIEDKYGNAYEPVAELGVTEFGVMADGEHIDILRGREWQIAKIGEAVFTGLASVPKIPMTNRGIATIQGIVEGQLQRGVKAGLLSEDPAPAVIVPDVADIDESDRLIRHLPDIEFTATYAGAIHTVGIRGTISF